MSFVGAVIDLITSLLNLLTSSSDPQPKLAADDDPFDDRDYWYDWRGLDARTFWQRIFEIEGAGEHGGPDGMAAKATELGLPGLRGYGRVKGTFMRHFQADPAFMQAMMDVQMARMQGQMDAAAAREGLLDPIEGVDCETWARLASQIARASGDYHRILAKAGIDAETYERVQERWMARMRSSSDPMGAAKIAQVYGAAFSAGNAAPADGPEPCTLERYAEIMGAMSAWSKEGRDPNAMLRSAFRLTEAQFSDLATYWGGRILRDIRLVERHATLVDFYEQRHRTAAAADADLVL